MYFTSLCIAASVSFFTLTIINLSTIQYAQEGGSKYATTATQQPQYQSREKVGIEVAYWQALFRDETYATPELDIVQ